MGHINKTMLLFYLFKSDGIKFEEKYNADIKPRSSAHARQPNFSKHLVNPTHPKLSAFLVGAERFYSALNLREFKRQKKIERPKIKKLGAQSKHCAPTRNCICIVGAEHFYSALNLREFERLKKLG